MTPDSHAQRKAKVYEAALTLTAQGVSPAAMTIQQLADAAGIGKGTVYEYFSSKDEILQGLARYCFESENERIAARFARCHTLADLENELVAYLQEVAAQRMSTYKILAISFGQQGPLPDCTDDCRRQLTALTDELLEACHMAIFCTVTGGLVALCCGANSGSPMPDLAQNLRGNLHRSLRTGK